MRIVVTGAGGFIGRFLTRTLAGQGHKVYALVRNSVPDFPSHIEQIELDFHDSDWAQYLPEKADVLIHLAQSREYRSFPEGYPDLFAINVRATFELLEWGRKRDVEKFIFSSTANVYKEKQGLLLETDPCLPSDMYAASKLCAEHLVQQYSKIFCTIICRIFTVYGPGQKHMLIPNIIMRILNREPITLAQHMGLILTPIHVEDVCDALAHLSENDSLKSGSIFNVSGNASISLKEIIDLISSELKIKPKIIVSDGEVRSLCGDSYYTSKFINSFKKFDSEIAEIIKNEYC